MQANRQFFPGSLVLAVTARIVAIWKGLRTKATTAFSLNVPDLSLGNIEKCCRAPYVASDNKIKPLDAAGDMLRHGAPGITRVLPKQADLADQPSHWVAKFMGCYGDEVIPRTYCRPP